jgi:hypothetical protein
VLLLLPVLPFLDVVWLLRRLRRGRTPPPWVRVGLTEESVGFYSTLGTTSCGARNCIPAVRSTTE